jgi:hypothetical protein
MTTKRIIKLGRQTALISFFYGTVIFGLYFLTSSSKLLFFGYAFIVITAVVNIGIIILILLRAEKDRENKTRLLVTFGLMLLNIPIMIVYCWFSLILLNTMRIKFLNTSDTILTGIKIIGCGGGYIDKLAPGETETVWIDITGDCTINIDYLSNGKRKQEIVVGYASMSMGQKLKHNIGGRNTDQL